MADADWRRVAAGGSWGEGDGGAKACRRTEPYALFASPTARFSSLTCARAPAEVLGAKERHRGPRARRISRGEKEGLEQRAQSTCMLRRRRRRPGSCAERRTGPQAAASQRHDPRTSPALTWTRVALPPLDPWEGVPKPN
jgi:hypothetical protein